MPNYYDDQKRLIATDTNTLIQYFQQISGTSNATELPIDLPCNPSSIIRITTSGVMPNFIYVGQPIAKNKIYPKILPTNTLSLNALCNGANEDNTIPVPDCGTVDCVALSIDTPDCGTVVFVTGYAETITITPNTANGWQLMGTSISSVQTDGTVTLNIQVINPSITTHTPFSFEHICDISLNGAPNNNIDYESTYHPNMPPSSTLRLDNTGVVSYSGFETGLSPDGATIEIFNVIYNKNN